MRQDSPPLVRAGQDRSDKVRTDQCGSGQDHKNNLKQAGVELGLTQAETVSLELDLLRVGLENIS